MNKIFTNFQVDMLKKHGKIIRLAYSNDGEYTYITLDGFVAYKIPNFEFLIDIEVYMDSDFVNDKTLIRFFDKAEDAVDSKLVGIIPPDMTPENFKKGLVHLNNGEDDSYYDYKLFKQFIGSEFTYKSGRNINPCYIYQNEVLIALILPVRYK